MTEWQAAAIGLLAPVVGVGLVVAFAWLLDRLR